MQMEYLAMWSQRMLGRPNLEECFRHGMETLPACITGPLCGEPPVTGGFPHKGPVMLVFLHGSFGVFNKLLNKQ